MNPRFQQVQEVLHRHRDGLLARGNVTSVGIGYKNGIVDPANLCIVVSVSRKVDAASLDRDDIVPPQIEGVPTDVVEAGPFHASSKGE